MSVKQFEIWLANLNPAWGTEPGKTRPVVIVQTNLLNDVHGSSIICPITTNVMPDVELLRVHLNEGQLNQLSDILVDQIRSIDNRRLLERIALLTKPQQQRLKENLKIILNLD